MLIQLAMESTNVDDFCSRLNERDISLEFSFCDQLYHIIVYLYPKQQEASSASPLPPEPSDRSVKSQRPIPTREEE